MGGENTGMCECVCHTEENTLSNDRGRRINPKFPLFPMRVARFQRLVAGFAARIEVSCGQKEMSSSLGSTGPGSGRRVPCDRGLQASSLLSRR